MRGITYRCSTAGLTDLKSSGGVAHHSTSSAHSCSLSRDEYDAAADGTRFALLVDERGLGERAPVADVELQRSGLDLLDDLSQLGRVAADMDELNPDVVLGELSSR